MKACTFKTRHLLLMALTAMGCQLGHFMSPQYSLAAPCYDLQGCKEEAKELINKNLDRVPEKAEDIRNDVSNSYGARWNNFRGADTPVAETLKDDEQMLKGNDFKSCNGGAHDAADIMQEPEIKFGEWPEKATPDMISGIREGCESGVPAMYVKYRGDETAGLCVRVTKVYFMGTCVAALYGFSDMVEYYYPTHKIDTSEQLYQSMYIDKDTVESIIPENREYFEKEDSNGRTMALDNAIWTRDTAIDATLRSMREMPEAQNLNIKTPEMMEGNDKAIEIAKRTIEGLSQLPDENRDTSPHSTHVFARDIMEPLNLATDAMYWIPHVAKVHALSMDQGVGYLYGKSLKYLADNYLFPDKMDKFLFTAGGQYACLRSNQMTHKAPLSINPFPNLTSVFPFTFPTPPPDTDGFRPSIRGGEHADVSTNLCLKKIGNRFPISNDPRSAHITDRTWQGVAMITDLYNELEPDPGNIGLTLPHWEATRHSWDEGEDKFLVLRSEDFKQDSPQCNTLNKMTKFNRDYDRANEKRIRSGGENTVEVFTKFKGCWGFKGFDSEFWHLPGGPLSVLGTDYGYFYPETNLRLH